MAVGGEDRRAVASELSKAAEATALAWLLVGVCAGGLPELADGNAEPFCTDAARFDHHDIDAERLDLLRRRSLRASRANLAAWYQPPSGVYILPLIAVMLVIAPARCSHMWGRTSWVSRAAPKTLTLTGAGLRSGARPRWRRRSRSRRR